MKRKKTPREDEGYDITRPDLPLRMRGNLWYLQRLIESIDRLTEAIKNEKKKDSKKSS